MEKHLAAPVSALLALCLAVVIAGCGGGGSSTSNDSPNSPSIVHITAHITTPTTWTSNNIYVLDSSITTSATLTIEPGTVVKFTQGKSLSVNAGGAIVADGVSAATPIVFTSVKDDGQGGDTNGDGAATTAARGDWAYIKVTANGSVFNHCVFAYGGSVSTTATLSLQNNSVVTVSNCTFAYNKGGLLNDYRGAALNAGDAGAGTVITGNTFYGNDMPLVINSLYDLDNSNSFHKLVSGGTITNRYNGIFWDGIYSQMGSTITWSNAEVPYVTNSAINVPAGSTLTLGDGVVIKFEAGERLDVSGVLISNATTTIVFTSIKDDSVAGDTNGDGTATSPAPGDWLGINVSANGSIFNKCLITYAGSSPYHAALEVGSTSKNAATVTNCTFAHNKGGTPADTRGAALSIANAGAGSIITGNTFYDNELPLVINGVTNINDSNVFHKLVSGVTCTNKYNGIFTDHPAVYGDVTWSETEVPFVMYNITLGIGNGMGDATPVGTLTLGDNVILKFFQGAGRIDIYNSGTLIQGNGNYFTSFNDDSLLGDTNGDGPSAGVDGDWTGINFCHGLCQWQTWGNILHSTY